MNVLLIFAISVAFYVKLATLSNFEKIHDYFGKPHLFLFLKKKQILNILRNLTNSVAFYGKFDIFGDVKKIQVFCWKKPSIFSQRDLKFEHFEKSVAFYGIFATFIVFWINSRFFPRRTHPLFRKHQTLNVLLNLTISAAFYGKLATFSNLKNFTIFFQKAYLFTLKKPNFWTFW